MDRDSYSSSSSSRSSSADGNYKRRQKRTRSPSKASRNLSAPGTSRGSDHKSCTPSNTPPLSKSNDTVSRLEALVEKLIKHQTKAKDKHHRGIRVAIKPESIPEFTPGNPNLSSAKWIAKIEQLAKINNWDEPTMIFLMQSRLSGLARRWYDNLSTYRLSWKEWKKLLVKSFPEHRDFATTLRALVNRMKLPTESWERYYFDKVELTNACDINGHRAVSCIIDGIEDPSVQAGARAGRYTSPDRLYAEYISVLKPEKSVSSTTVAKTAFTTAHRRPLSERERSNEPPPKKAKPPARRPPKCYNCRDEGHFADKCPKPKVECASCKRLGHLTKDCRRQSIKNQVVLEKDLAPVNSSYFFDCWVNETPSQAYVDSGCGAVLIREDTANMLNMERSPCTKYVIGYGGVATKTLGKLIIRLKIDGAEAEVESLIVPNTAQEIPVLVGQTFLNQDEIMMIVSGQTVRVTRRGSDLCETLDVPPRKIPLWAKESIVLEPRTALVAVTSRGACADDVYVKGGLRPLPDGEHVVHECITKGEDGYVAITNLSYRHIEGNSLHGDAEAGSVADCYRCRHVAATGPAPVMLAPLAWTGAERRETAERNDVENIWRTSGALTGTSLRTVMEKAFGWLVITSLSWVIVSNSGISTSISYMISMWGRMSWGGLGYLPHSTPVLRPRLFAMVRDYVRKTERQNWSVQSMNQAVLAVVNEELGYKKAATQFGVPQTTLERYVKKKKQAKDNFKIDKTAGKFRPVFTHEQEL
ncbi:uncharacterized protein LOC135131703 [Zophobas morio]|uniref:uncharacterized protein LOC135131703 n=1 Tax=Zophobas morio TaxID=2755281 RepID=UPI003083C766